MILNPDFKSVPPRFLKSIARDSERIPTLYHATNWLLCEFFWLRLRLLDGLITKLIKINTATCLDFGGGGGVFLPTLTKRFKSVTLVDLETIEARQVVQLFKLPNVEIIRGDIHKLDMGGKTYDAIVAADVLEHFKDLPGPVEAISKWLKPGGLLFTSLPTETGIYALLRRIFGIQKPWDHYHTAWEVEDFLRKNGFEEVRKIYHPLFLRISPLFSIGAWRLTKVHLIKRK
jgi:2-polyprenyl-3-methyl-5-hydroxy-6-metoxy-1,4-benzoquinol methylase